MRKCIVAGIFFLSVFSSAFPAAKKIDIDFTKMGKTMAYAMLYNTCFDQEKYIGNMWLENFKNLTYVLRAICGDLLEVRG